MHGLRACFNNATQIFSLYLLDYHMRCIYLWTISDGKLTNLKHLKHGLELDRYGNYDYNVAENVLSPGVERDRRHEIKDDVCEVITKFASHALRAVYLSERISFWSQSGIPWMLNSCQELVILGVDGNMVDAQFIWTLGTQFIGDSSRIELCVCRCPY